jgi:predicted DNA-binding ribbon-helix-helix protein
MRRLRSPHIRFVRVNGQRTSITLEAEFWEQFRLIVLEYGTSISAMLAEIDRTMRLMPKQRPRRHRVLTLSAAVRLFVLKDVMARSSEDAQASRDRASPWAFPQEPHASHHAPKPRHSCPKDQPSA